MRGRQWLPAEQRFANNFIPEPNSGCWLWEAQCNAHGYGVIWSKRSWLAHRFSYRLYVGEIPEGLCVLHQCDMPCCVNPDHLFLGTQQQNIADMEAKKRGRHPHSEDHGRARLTNEQIKFIRQSELRQGLLAEKFGVPVHVIKYARQKDTWKGVV